MAKTLDHEAKSIFMKAIVIWTTKGQDYRNYRLRFTRSRSRTKPKATQAAM